MGRLAVSVAQARRASTLDSAMVLIDAENISASRPQKPLFDGLSVTLHDGDHLGIVGRNGTGKSTLLRILAGIDEPESGVVRTRRGLRVEFLDQHGTLPSGTVQAAVGTHWEADAALDRLGCTSLLQRDVDSLSGGERKRVALARVLVNSADVVVLDEPTNHLDIDGIEWLESTLVSSKQTLVLVTHDRHMLDATTTKILELDHTDSFVHQGGYSSYLEAKVKRIADAESRSQKNRNLARTELEWLRRGAPARTAKSRARIRSARKILETANEPPPDTQDALDLHFGTPRLGNTVVELHGVGHRDLFGGIDLALDDDERLGIVGPNGAGKTTLLDIMAGLIEPTEGTVVHGKTVAIEYYTQLGPQWDLTRRVRDVVAGDAEPDWRDARFLEEFWFAEDAQWAPVELLSGGERRRLQLVLALRSQPNVLLLDEPTNDLDVDTLRVLENFLDSWPGALVVVSHDRAFLERTVDDLVLIDDGTAGRVPGGLDGWLRSRRSRKKGHAGETGPSASPTPPKPSQSGRSTSTIRHEIRDVDKRLAAIGRKSERFAVQLADQSLDHAQRAVLGAELAELDAEVAQLEDRWLELNDELETR